MNKIWSILLCAGYFMLGTRAYAETLTGVSIEGTARIEKATILNYLGLEKGMDVTPADTDKAVKTLFDTGLFSSVQINLKNGIAHVVVQENPIVHDVYFEGNKKLDDDVLKTEVLLKPRMVFTKHKLKNDAERLLEVYKRNGRFGASIVPKIIEKDQNRVDVVFEINEGEKTTIQKINIIGNKAFSADTLKDEMVTKEKAWYRFLTSMDTYDPDRLNYDKELLRRFYLENGYVDFKVLNSVAELTPDNNHFIITLEISEGVRYRFDTPDIQVSLPEYQDQVNLAMYTDFKTGDFFNSERVEEAIEKLTHKFSNEGYAFVDVTPEFQKDEAQRRVKIIFKVTEGEKVFVRRIDIAGNSRTLDKVIRREFKLQEGDVFNASKLRRSKQRVENLDYFSKVAFETRPVYDDPGKSDVVVDVAEKSTGAFNIGVGWSSYDGLMFETGITERNILGSGKTVGINALLAQKETQYAISLTDPYFMDLPLIAGWDIFHTTRDNTDSSSYSYTSTGTTLRFGWDYTDFLGQSVRYTLRQDDIHDIDEDASIYIKEQRGKNLVSLIGQELFYDRRDSRINPTQGYYLSLGSDIAGLGGDSKFFRINVMAIRYFPVIEEVVFSIRGDAGRIWGLAGQNVRINDRYFLGDTSLRGFEYGGVGARDKATGDALGANWYTSASAELTFPLGLPKEMGIRGKVFSDAAFIGKPDHYDAQTMAYSNDLRLAVGTGILWQSPMGMINLDFSYAAKKASYDRTKVFRLNFGNSF